jgi:hypothetical protein
LDLALVISPTGTCNGSFNVLAYLESSPTSKRKRSETLNVALMLYSPGRSSLYALSLILSCLRNFSYVFSSFPLSLKGFDLESSPTSKRKRSETLNVALMLYSPGRSSLYALSLILSRT